ncbi:MAG TPA: glycosyltransferase family 39 protein [Candidatus Sulfotelmatobacter sp.]|nr:glycosyltransferase family 39 protein [Candidatus Sulfotelmatobacter sp.]
MSPRPWAMARAWAWPAAATVVVVGSILLRAAFLDQRQMFKDEGASWLLSSFALPNLISHTMQDVYPPLYALVLHFWMIAFGDSVTTLRLLSVLLGLGVVAAAWRWGHEALGRNWGLVVLMGVGLSGLALEDAREVRMHVLEVLSATIAWWLVWRLSRQREPGRPWRTIAVLVVAVAGELWTSPMGLPTIALQGMFVLSVVVFGRRAGARSALLGLFLGGLTFLPWLPVQLSVVFNGQAFWTPVPDPVLLPYAFDTQLMGRGHTRVLPIIAGLPLLALALGGYLDLLRGRTGPLAERDDDRFLAWMLTFALALIPLAWLYSQVHSVWDVEYFGNILPALAIALAAGGRALARRLTPHDARTLVACGLVIFIVLGLSSTQRLQQRLADEDLTPAVQVYDQLAPMARPGDVVLAIDSRSYFAIDYLVARTDDPLPLAAPLYTWDNGHEPFFYGQGLVPPDRLIDPAWVTQQGGWSSAFPGLKSGGRIFLIDLEDDDLTAIGFGPLDDGTLHQVSRQDIAYAGRIAQIRTLVVP